MVKYWQLLSIFSDEKDILAEINTYVFDKFKFSKNTVNYQVVLSNEEFAPFFLKSEKRFYINNAYLYLHKHIENNKNTLPAFDAFTLYEVTAIEEVLEKGSFEVPK